MATQRGVVTKDVDYPCGGSDRKVGPASDFLARQRNAVDAFEHFVSVKVNKVAAREGNNLSLEALVKPPKALFSIYFGQHPERRLLLVGWIDLKPQPHRVEGIK